MTPAVKSETGNGKGPSWFLLESGACASAENMAWDEALLEFVAQFGRPVLRFYGWQEPAATFGYFQKLADVERMTALRPLIRRPTGGGLVPHEADWTYSLVIPPSDPWYELKAIASYRRIHEWIQAAFAGIKVETVLASTVRGGGTGQCFAGAEPFDVLQNERKVAGAAQRRNRSGLLIQGSIQPPPVIARADFERSFRRVAERAWKVSWVPVTVSAGLHDRVVELTEVKYSRESHNRAR
jgi:lipoate-protein ligase A